MMSGSAEQRTDERSRHADKARGGVGGSFSAQSKFFVLSPPFALHLQGETGSRGCYQPPEVALPACLQYQ